jgi:hypothetical protein
LLSRGPYPANDRTTAARIRRLTANTVKHIDQDNDPIKQVAATMAEFVSGAQPIPNMVLDIWSTNHEQIPCLDQVYQAICQP